MVLSFASNMLNRLKWTKRLPRTEVVILHRGASKGRKSIPGDRITEIKKGHFYYMDAESSKETFIPVHRVLEIWMDDDLVWKKRERKKPETSAKGKPSKRGVKSKKIKPNPKGASTRKRRGRKSSPRR